MRETQRAEWTARVESFARDAAPRTRPFAEALVELLPPPRGGRVLDVATGTGIVAAEAARRAGANGSVLATDFIAEWEPYVLATAAEAGAVNIRFAPMPAESLELPDASFDVVYCQFGLMFVPNPVAALREMRRVLRPEGRLGIAVWSVPETVGIFLISRVVAPALPPAEGEPPLSPLGMGAPGLLEGLVARAGFRDVAAQLVTRHYEVADAEAEWRRWSADTVSPIAQGVRELPAREQRRLREEVIAAIESFRDGETIRVPSEAVVVTASR